MPMAAGTTLNPTIRGNDQNTGMCDSQHVSRPGEVDRCPANSVKKIVATLLLVLGVPPFFFAQLYQGTINSYLNAHCKKRRFAPYQVMSGRWTESFELDVRF